MGEQAKAEVVSMHVKDNEKVKIENIELTAMYTPGHTDDSYSFMDATKSAILGAIGSPVYKRTG